MLVLHPKPGGLISMQDPRARREINLDGRLIVGLEKEHTWRSMESGIEAKYLISPELGPSVTVVRAPRGAALVGGPAPFGRYEIVLEGSVLVEERELGPPGVRFIRGSEAPTPLRAGPEGATVMFSSFDHDVLAGGLTGEGIAREAAEALARAI